jgi:CRP-like cAMP-binding protein
MIIKQADLFHGLSHNFIKDLMTIATRVSFSEGEVVFRSGEPAEHFYILIQGCVKIRLGQDGRDVYTGEKLGEIFGWSSLIGRKDFTASAVCSAPTSLLRVDRRQFQNILEKDLFSSLMFFQQLAKVLGNRLIQLYGRDTQETREASKPEREAAV